MFLKKLNKKYFNKNLNLVPIILIILLSRFIPHPPNFTPIISIAILCPLFFKKTNTKPQHKYTYYLAAQTKPQLIKIKETLSKLKTHESKICIRPHPRYSDLSVVKKVFKMFKIEDLYEVSIEESVNNTQNVVSLYSTVLFQSLLSGKSIVIDDISDNKKFEKLKELKYALLSKTPELLSNLLQKN